MGAVLEWPMTKCESCGYDLREAAPKTSEKGNDSSGRLKWTDFCPQCGVGMFVGERVLPVPPEEVLVEREAKAILQDQTTGQELEKFDPEHLVTSGTAKVAEPSGIPPDQRGKELAEETDPEGLIDKQTETTVAEEKPEPGAIRSPKEGEYFCTKCASNHRDTDKPKSIGLRHKKYQEA